MRALLLLSTIALLPAQTLDQLATEELSKQHIPGIVIVAVKDGRVMYAKGFGVASTETNAPVTPDALFRVGSTTKMMVATATVKLAERGKLRLDAPVGSYITGLSPKVAKLTPHQILSHTSGLMDETKMYGSHDDEALERNVSSWKDDVFFTQPGRIYSYSNLGFVLAGRLIEVVNGKPFADSMEELVFKPLEMKSTTFRPTTAMTYPLAVGHTAAGAVSRPAADHAGYWPAGSMFTSGNDFAKFAIAFMNGDVPQALAKPNVDVPGLRPGVKYGYGLQIDTMTGIVEHGGSRAGYRSHLMMAPQFKTGVVVLCNKDGALPGPIAKKALDLLLPTKIAEPSPSQPGTMDLTKLAGKYVNGPNTVEVTLQSGQLTIGKRPLEAATTTCFRNAATTACFVNGYLHTGGRSYARAN